MDVEGQVDLQLMLQTMLGVRYSYPFGCCHSTSHPRRYYPSHDCHDWNAS